MNTMTPIMAINAQKPPATIPANKATIPAQMNSHTATINAQMNIKASHPIGKHMQIKVITSKAIKNFLISV